MNKSNNKLIRTMITLSLGLALSACGGSSSTKAPDPDPIPVVNIAPVISSTAITTIEAGTAYSYTLVSTDADGDALVLSASSLPAWLTFDVATGILSGTPAQSDAGDYAITLTVTDGTGSATQTFTITVTVPVVPNNAPVITSTGVTSATVGVVYSYTLAATDADNDTLTMSATIPGALSWLTFDAATGMLSGTPASGDIATTAITLTVSDGTDDTMQTFNITVADVVATNIVTDFEKDPTTYAFNNFDGGVSTVMANPQISGINISAQVVQMQKFAGQPWGGSTYTLDAPVNIAAGSNNFKIKVYSDRAVAVLFKLEGMTAELSADHTGSGWEELSYDFTLSTGTLSKITLIFDLGTMGDAAGNAANWTFYYDDITTPISVQAAPANFVAVGTPFDFETGGLGADFAWAVFENDDNPALEFVANPAPTSTVNTSSTVAMFTARQTGQPWAGTETTSANTPAFTMDATNSIVKIMVYKSVISDVGIKFSVGAAAQPEMKVANTKINEWEELTFDFSSRIGMAETIGIDSVIVFPDFNARATDTVSYFDNIRLGHN